MELNQILKAAFEADASDVHLIAGHVPMMRVHQVMTPMPMPVITNELAQGFLATMAGPEARSTFDRTKDSDFSYHCEGLARYRVNAHMQRGRIGFSMRMIKTKVPPLSKLSLPEVIQKLTYLPRGLVLVTGDTGSGKSTTLAAMIDAMNQRYKKHIITLEDPIEYVFESKECVIEQRELHQDMPTFASGLKHALRQDPDIILVGEIRDQETAEMAFRAAMTGHQVFSTLHANSAVLSIPRLVDMGVTPDLITGNLIGIVAQRLVRKLCPKCKSAYTPSEPERLLLGMKEADQAPLYRPVGCAACNGAGYKGRMALTELLRFDEMLDDMVAQGVRSAEILAYARKEGFSTMAEDGVHRVIEGATALEEVARVVDLTRIGRT